MNAPLDPVARDLDKLARFGNVGSALADASSHGVIPEKAYIGSALRTNPSVPAITVRGADPTQFQKNGRKEPLEISPEAHFILACARTKLDEASQAAIRNLLSHPLDWNVVLSLATRHRIRPLLHASLAAIRLPAVPADVSTWLQNFTTANARRSLYLVGELFKLLDLLQSHGIPAAPFKGPMLAAYAYGSPAFREAGDLDLLVRREDMTRVKRLLITHGFQAAFPTSTPREAAFLQSLDGRREEHYLLNHAEHHFGRTEGELNLDVHTGLALCEFWLQLKPGDLWRWITPCTFAGRKIPGFGPEHTLLMLCINGSKDCWERLDRICDVAELLRAHRELDWQQVFSTARKLGIARMVCVGLRLAADLLGATLPAEADRIVRRDRTISRITARIRRQLFAEAARSVESASLARSLLQLQMRERLHDQLGNCLARLEPTVGDWASVPLPKALSCMHYLIRPLRLIAQHLISPSESRKNHNRLDDFEGM